MQRHTYLIAFLSLVLGACSATVDVTGEDPRPKSGSKGSEDSETAADDEPNVPASNGSETPGTGTGSGRGQGNGNQARDGGAIDAGDASATSDGGAPDASSEGGTKKAFGETCAADGDCASNACFRGGMQAYCSLRCTPATQAQDCPVPPTAGVCNNQGFCRKN